MRSLVKAGRERGVNAVRAGFGPSWLTLGNSTGCWETVSIICRCLFRKGNAKGASDHQYVLREMFKTDLVYPIGRYVVRT